MDKDIIEKILFQGGIDPNLQLPDPSLVSHYTNYSNRIYWLNGEIDDGTMELAEAIINWNREDKDIPLEQRKPIKILFASNGGSLDIEETLVSLIELSKTPIYAVAIGFTASAASLIYLACHKRYALPNVRFLFHKGSCNNLGGSYAEVQSFMEDYRAQVEKMVEFYKNHTSFNAEVIEEKMNTGDWYINIDEALENGVVNEIVNDIEIFL